VPSLGSLIFDCADRTRFTISGEAQDELSTHRQLAGGAKEAGGILLGRIVSTGTDVIVDRISAPDPRDGRSRFWFRRRRKPAQVIVDTAWSTSRGTCIYLGEWHSHPEDVPQPSQHDRSEWVRIAGEAKFEQDRLFFVIVGRLAIGAWSLRKCGSQIEQLTPASFRVVSPTNNNRNPFSASEEA
jgi:integrative and conjugative element protein (TIGR02256 family)